MSNTVFNSLSTDEELKIRVTAQNTQEVRHTIELEHYALAAMPSLIAEGWNPKQVAKRAFEIAKAMRHEEDASHCA